MRHVVLLITILSLLLCSVPIILGSETVSDPVESLVETEPPCPGYTIQASYDGDCKNRPKGTVCARFSIKFVWLIETSVMDWRKEVCNDNKVLIAEGGDGYDYYNILGTNYVKKVKRKDPVSLN